MIDNPSVGVSTTHIPEQVSSPENQTLMPGTDIPFDLCDLNPSTLQTKPCEGHLVENSFSGKLRRQAGGVYLFVNGKPEKVKNRA